MFDKFGEMNSCEDLNELAQNLFNEGDMDSVRIMAKENGIPEDYAEMYLEGTIPELCDPLIAATGKLDLESQELDLKGLMIDWVEYIKGLCMESDLMARKVRQKGKNLKSCMAVLLKYSFSNRAAVDKKIVKEAGVSGARVEFGVPGMAEAKKMIKEYYLK